MPQVLYPEDPDDDDLMYILEAVSSKKIYNCSKDDYHDGIEEYKNRVKADVGIGMGKRQPKAKVSPLPGFAVR